MSNNNGRLTVGCLLTVGNRLVLVQEVQNGAIHWDIPAGGIDAGESPEQAIIRELQEEVCLETAKDQLRLRGVYVGCIGQQPTVHFLYEQPISEDQFSSLRPGDPDIKAVRLFDKSDVRQLLDQGRYEHSLAQVRLASFLRPVLSEAAVNIGRF